MSHQELLPLDCKESVFKQWLAESPIARLLEVKAYAET